MSWRRVRNVSETGEGDTFADASTAARHAARYQRMGWTVRVRRLRTGRYAIETDDSHLRG